MDPGWDHSENEDKLLLDHTLAMGTFREIDMGKDMYGSEVRSVSSSGCNSDNVSVSGDGLISLGSEYNKHLSSVVLNNVNHLYFDPFTYFQINLWNLSIYLNNITNLINLSYHNVILFFNTVCSIYRLIDTKCNICIVICLKFFLNQIKVKLHELYSELRSLCTTIVFFNHLKSEWDMIIKSLKYIININEKLSELTNKFKCSTSEINKIESKIKCAKTIICQINELKQKLCKKIEKILFLICISSENISIKIIITNVKSVRKKLELLNKNIDTLLSDIGMIESHSNSLKLSISKIINLKISRNSQEQFQYIHLIFNTDIDEICSLINWLNCWICNISNICNSTRDCKCNCSCKAQCAKNTICLCICSCTSSPSVSSNGCCVCICKKANGNCKCICICVCNKTGGQCCCQSGEHNCKDCFVKVDITSLKDQTKKITQYLSWIRCQTTINCYKPIISRIHWIELLFNQIGNKISQLITLKNILSPLLIISTKCKPCKGDCCNKIKELIDIISISCSYYYKFGSRIGDIRSFVEYKLFYPKSKQILNLLQLSLKPLLNKLTEINSQVLINVDLTRMSNQLLMSVYSQYSILECYVSLSNLSIYSSKLSIALYINQIVENCLCVGNFNSNGTKFKTTDFHKYLNNCCVKKVEDPSKLFINNDGNHTCLCLVVKYALYPSLIKSMYYLRYVYLETITKQTREFLTKKNIIMSLNDAIKMFFIIIDVIYGLSMFMERRYLWTTSNVESISNGFCFCRAPKDKYYSFLTSILLYVSSLMENIWSMDTESVRMTIDNLSTLYSQLEIYDLSSVNDTKKIICNSLYTLMVDKDCKKPCQCKPGEKCCCWCVTCFNLVVMCVSLSLQCKLCNAICNNKEKTNGCEKVKNFCELKECECKCQQGKKGLCCLFQLALCSQVPSSTGNGCKELQKLEDCCEQCQNGQDSCCKKILEKVKAGKSKLLLLGCCCNDGKCGCDTTTDSEVKVKCLLFKNPYSDKSAEVVIFCKCQKTAKGCCLYNLVDKLKEKLENLCKGQDCCCEQLKKSCEDLCCASECKGECVCAKLKKSCQEICGNNNDCLCKKIDETISKCCTKGTCQCCKDNEGCCKCVCCKLVGQSIKILVRGCRANVLEPYKRITIELLNSSKNKKEVIRSILERINRTTVNNIYLVKNSRSSYPYSIGGYTPTIDGVTNVETRNWGYDTKYEHDVTTDKGFRRGDGHLINSFN